MGYISSPTRRQPCTMRVVRLVLARADLRKHISPDSEKTPKSRKERPARYRRLEYGERRVKTSSRRSGPVRAGPFYDLDSW